MRGRKAWFQKGHALEENAVEAMRKGGNRRVIWASLYAWIAKEIVQARKLGYREIVYVRVILTVSGPRVP